MKVTNETTKAQWEEYFNRNGKRLRWYSEFVCQNDDYKSHYILYDYDGKTLADDKVFLMELARLAGEDYLLVTGVGDANGMEYTSEPKTGKAFFLPKLPLMEVLDLNVSMRQELVETVSYLRGSASMQERVKVLEKLPEVAEQAHEDVLHGNWDLVYDWVNRLATSFIEVVEEFDFDCQDLERLQVLYDLFPL